MSPKCQIIINGLREGHLIAGQRVTGTVKFAIYKTIRYDSIDILFVGCGQCYFTSELLDGEYETITLSNEERYVFINKNLFKPAEDQMFEPGDYEYPFEFSLPDDVPSSVKTASCDIQYKIFVKFSRKGTFISKSENDLTVPVYGYVKPCSRQPLTFKVEKKLLSFNPNNKITVKGEIDRTCLKPGDSIHLTMTVTNDSNVDIYIKSQLVYFNTYISKGESPSKHIEKGSIPGTKETSPTIRANSVLELERTIPILDTLYSIQNSKIMVGEFKVKVTVKAPFPHGKAYARVPVVIGWRKEEHESLIQRDLPPSYSEAIRGNN
ncbi:arrestin domain-containing protein 2-like [Helicoverpa armigera]|uniref:arrestin domain-containing protein 2-like n=1 Tax=Helicoverpa armigera TaxID=29058 RepID=UPI003083D24E